MAAVFRLSVRLRPVEVDDLPNFFAHQLDPEATRLAGFPSRDRAAFMTHWTTRIIGNPDSTTRTILVNDLVAGYVSAWTDAKLTNACSATGSAGSSGAGASPPRRSGNSSR